MPTQVLLLAYWNARQVHTLHLLFHFSRKALKVPQMQTASEMLRAAALAQAWAEHKVMPLGRRGGGGVRARKTNQKETEKQNKALLLLQRQEGT